MEKIGYISKEILNLNEGLSAIDQLKDSEINFDFRDIVETRGYVLQPICVGVVTTKDNKILALNKTDKCAGDKSPELGKTLLYIGGHLDISDFTDNNIETFKNAMKREILEEINFKLDDKFISDGFVVYTPFTERSSRHFGVVFKVILDNEYDFNFTDGVCRFVDINELKDINNIDSWSEIIIENL